MIGDWCGGSDSRRSMITGLQWRRRVAAGCDGGGSDSGGGGSDSGGNDYYVITR